MTMAPFYGADEIRRLVSQPACIDVVRSAMAEFSASGAVMPLRTIETVPGAGFLGVMPGWLGEGRGCGTKIVTVFEDAERPGRARHQGLVLLFDRRSGELLCSADAEIITELRTAAASAAATALMARPDSARLAIFGCGRQAEAHVRAISAIQPLSQVVVWGRAFETAADFAGRIADSCGIAVRAVADPRAAAEGADIICTLTGSSTPILLGDWVDAGTHINLVGSSHAEAREIDTRLVARSRFIADSRRSALTASGEFLAAKAEGVVDDAHIKGEIGEVIAGRVAGRTRADEITIYKSLGHIVQDLAVAEHVHTMASARSTAQQGNGRCAAPAAAGQR